MKLLKAGLLLVVLGGLFATTVQAFEPGDFAPRGSLLYMRANDLSGAVQKLGGESWKSEVERMLLARDKRDFDQSEAVIEEVRRFADYLGMTEFIISDVMVREPFFQMALVSQLKEGAPTEFSEEFINFIKEEDKDIEATKNSIKFENGALWLKGGVLVLSSGGMMDAHVQDVLDGFTDESLSKVERFTKWSAKANADLVAFADMKAWRTALDRLGEDFDAELRHALETVEWQKWDLITARATLPGKTSGGISVDISLSLNQPFENVNAFMKPSGGSLLVNMLPRETVGFLSMQLGRQHQQTYNDLLRFFHDFEQNDRPARLERRIRWAESDLEWAEERLKNLREESDGDKESDKDASGNPEPQRATPKPVEVKPVSPEGEEEYDPIKDAEADVERAKQELADLRDQLSKHKFRAFQPDPDLRQGEETDAEGFHDGFERAIAEFGFTREEVLGAIGQEVMLGIVDLPDPGFDGNDPGDAYGDMWFVLVETQDTFPVLKDRFLDRVLARKLPADMPAEEVERAKRDAEKAIFKKVEGGELIREKGLRADWCAFAGEGFVGFAPNEEVALMIMKAGLGQGRMDTSNIPGGLVSGSKVAYLNLGDFLGKIATGMKNRRRRYADFPNPYFQLDKYMPGGFHLSISSDEGSQGVLFSLRTGGESNADGALKMFGDEISNMKASRHDEIELRALGDGIEAWYNDNRDALAAMEVGERTKAIKAVTPEMLVAGGMYTPVDGLRSAFDPAMDKRFVRMLANYETRLGHADGAEENAKDLSEASFEWFGLPTNLDIGEDDYYSKGDSPVTGTPICAMMGDWAHDGRFVVIWSNGPRVVWYDSADYAAMMDATRNGKEWQPVDPATVNPPKWRVRRLMNRKSYDMYDLQSRMRQASERAKEENRELELKFVGKDKENALQALRDLLGIDEEDWFHFEDARNLTVTTDAEGKAKARYENWGQWIEIDSEGNLTSSFDE
ncbi:MAG: hypothetical protein KDB68_03850 [Planctomycetes bacterium]|nr:hypothetical protein [Planctomycetota bacterium]